MGQSVASDDLLLRGFGFQLTEIIGGGRGIRTPKGLAARWISSPLPCQLRLALRVVTRPALTIHRASRCPLSRTIRMCVGDYFSRASQLPCSRRGTRPPPRPPASGPSYRRHDPARRGFQAEPRDRHVAERVQDRSGRGLLFRRHRAEPARDPQLKPISELADGQILSASGDSLRQFVTQAMRSASPDGQLIRRAIAFDAASRPREVGGPTSILEVDRAGARSSSRVSARR
jgi:hypothetical protein